MFGHQVDGLPFDASRVHVPRGTDLSSLCHLHWAVNGHQLVEADGLLLVDRFLRSWFIRVSLFGF